MNEKFIHRFAITTFVALYIIVSFFSTFHVVSFFALSNPMWVAIGLAIAFEVGAAASLAALTILDKLSKNLVMFLFIMLTLMQMMGNMYYSYVNLHDFTAWSELFFLSAEPILLQKQILSFISGGILPLIALGFIKSLIDYIKPSKKIHLEEIHQEVVEKKKEAIQIKDENTGTNKVPVIVEDNSSGNVNIPIDTSVVHAHNVPGVKA